MCMHDASMSAIIDRPGYRKSMKTGKNRPLDEDELDFMNELQSRERSKVCYGKAPSAP